MYYDTSNGLTLLFNFHNDRNYSDQEINNLQSRVFDNRAFVYKDLNRKEFLATIQDLPKSEKLKGVSHLTLFLGSHGGPGYVITNDNPPQSVRLIELVKALNSENCPELAGKPKIIIVSACRGESFDPGVYPSSESNPADDLLSPGAYMNELARIRRSLEPHFFIIYSTTPGRVSWRGHFITYFSEVVEESKSLDVCHRTITNLTTRANQRLAKEFLSMTLDSNRFKKQVGNFVSTLTHRLIFCEPIINIGLN